VRNNQNLIAATALMCALCVACAGSGGGAGVATVSPATNNSTGSSGSSGSVMPTSYDTGSSGQISTPLPASYGTSPVPAQFATPAGATFDGSSGHYPAPNVSFPVLATGLQFTTDGVSPVSLGQGATATIIGTAPGQYNPSATAVNFQLVIPSANVNAQIQVGLDGATQLVDANPTGLSYVVLGEWGGTGANGVPLGKPLTQSGPVIEYVFGYETPSSAMPKTGQAAFVGTAFGWVYAPNSGRVLEAFVTGNATFSADFTSGKLTGGFTGMGMYNGSSSSAPWNDISVTAPIASGTNRFSGTASVTSTTPQPFGLAASATGHIDGAFFGPSAQNIGAVWSLSDGTASAMGLVQAGHN
jgi:hypothetical protein